MVNRMLGRESCPSVWNEDSVFPLRAEACALPFASGFFDVITCIDAFSYFGTDDTALMKLARFIKLGGQIGIVGAGLMKEIKGELPQHLQFWWEPELWSLHSPGWWKQHWERAGCVDFETADTFQDGGAILEILA